MPSVKPRIFNFFYTVVAQLPKIMYLSTHSSAENDGISFICEPKRKTSGLTIHFVLIVYLFFAKYKWLDSPCEKILVYVCVPDINYV